MMWMQMWSRPTGQFLWKQGGIWGEITVFQKLLDLMGVGLDGGPCWQPIRKHLREGQANQCTAPPCCPYVRAGLGFEGSMGKGMAWRLWGEKEEKGCLGQVFLPLLGERSRASETEVGRSQCVRCR